MTKPIVLITGGSKGIGFATAEYCLKEGKRVILVARGLDNLMYARERLVKNGHSGDDIAVQEADLSLSGMIAGWVNDLPWIQEDGLWGLVSNAAVEILKPVTDYSFEDIIMTTSVNIISPILLFQACHPHLKKAMGSIVQVGSIADFKREARYSLYGGSKAFMKSFIGHAGQELGFDGIRINLVSPGATETEMMKEMRDVQKVWPEEQIENFLKSIPIEQRNATPEEIAEAIYFALAGPRYFHGDDLRIYGGHP
ncbi:MAG: SDR family NAD(P)-dependent oxidoreductase [Puniceicoccaceae bacterium]